MVLKRKIGDDSSTFVVQPAASEDSAYAIAVAQDRDGTLQLDTSAACFQDKALAKMLEVYYVQNHDMPGLLANVLQCIKE